MVEAKTAENRAFLNGTPVASTDSKPVGPPCAPEKPKRGGRPKGSVNKVTGIAKEAILAAEPHSFLIRVMEGRKFMRAGENAGRKTTACFPTLEQSVVAAETLLRKISPDIRATELSGPDGGPIEQRTEILEASERVLVAMSAASSADDTVATIGPDALEGVKALNYIQASQEAAERDQAPDRTPAGPRSRQRHSCFIW